MLRLDLIVQVEEESGGIMGGAGKVVLHLAQPIRGMLETIVELLPQQSYSSGLDIGFG